MENDETANAPAAETTEQQFRKYCPPRLIGSPEAKMLALMMGLSEDDPEFAEALRNLEYNSEMEMIGDVMGNNLKLSDHTAYLDLAFRYYLGGGKSEPDERSFVLALKAQEQMFVTLNGLRRFKRQVEQDRLAYERENTRNNEKLVRKYAKK